MTIYLFFSCCCSFVNLFLFSMTKKKVFFVDLFCCIDKLKKPTTNSYVTVALRASEEEKKLQLLTDIDWRAFKQIRTQIVMDGHYTSIFVAQNRRCQCRFVLRIVFFPSFGVAVVIVSFFLLFFKSHMLSSKTSKTKILYRARSARNITHIA